MAGITQKVAEEHLQVWLEAELALASHQSYKIGTRMLTKADLGEVRQTIKYWEAKANQCSRTGRNRMMRAVPRDL